MLKTLIWCILWGGFVLFAVTWFCDWMDNREENLREDHRRYHNREMNKWEATIYENWTVKGILGKLGTLIKLAILLFMFWKAILFSILLAIGLFIFLFAMCLFGGFSIMPPWF